MHKTLSEIIKDWLLFYIPVALLAVIPFGFFGAAVYGDLAGNQTALLIGGIGLLPSMFLFWMIPAFISIVCFDKSGSGSVTHYP